MNETVFPSARRQAFQFDEEPHDSVMPNSAHAGALGWRLTVPWLVFLLALGFGVAAAIVYSRIGLTLSHPDSRAHLVVARRVLDSLTPGWRQIGAVWLPLPHLINLFPVQIDLFYRTGLFAVGVSVLSFGAAAFAVSRAISSVTGSPLAALAGSAILVLNPNLLYIQSTPMTEPMFIASVALAVTFGLDWLAGARWPRAAHLTGLSLAAACLTRYEGWAVSAVLVGVGTYVLLRQGHRPAAVLRRAAAVAAYPAGAIAAFFVLSRLTIGEWFASPLFMRANPAKGRALDAAVQVIQGLCSVEHTAVVLLAAAGMLIVAAAGLRPSSRATSLLALSLVAPIVFPWHAYYEGHPFRARYMIQLLPAIALLAGVAVGCLGRARNAAAVLVMAVAAITTPPFDFLAPMLHEAQWDLRKSVQRQKVVAYLDAHYRGERILISMGGLAHFMHETSAARLDIRDFIHEGSGGLWTRALEHPGDYAGWIVIKADDVQRRDRLLAILKTRAGFVEGFSKVAEGGGVALYRRRETTD
jgi:hypothetical protein